MTIQNSPPTSTPPSPGWSNTSSYCTDGGWTTVSKSPESLRRKAKPQRQRFYSAGCESSAKKTPPSRNSVRKTRAASDTSNWWRTPTQEPQNRTRFVLASRALFTANTPTKSTPLSCPNTPPKTEDESSKKFVLIPIESINQRIIATEQTDTGVTVTIRQTSNKPGHGWLQDSCHEIFCQAYGLDGFKRIDHRDLYRKLVEKHQCSRRSFLELVYAHSYQDSLGKLREQVPNYPVKSPAKKKQNNNREAVLERRAVVMKVLPKEQETTQKKTTHEGKGALEEMCVNLFCRAYGLNGFQREDHNELYKEVAEKSQCSRRAFLECLYGHSYSKFLGVLREIVPNYPAKIHLHKKNKRDTEAILEHLSVAMGITAIHKSSPVQQSTLLRATAPIYTPQNLVL